MPDHNEGVFFCQNYGEHLLVTDESHMCGSNLRMREPSGDVGVNVFVYNVSLTELRSPFPPPICFHRGCRFPGGDFLF